ncbi:hypothetical protein CALVIDRAFT_528438 [Calocera viscosa TUFC12733]|uniref:Knr4/Smi1-like domain-containing protein n=1 Tax=Calocera viscosa (strain TUFC12733) TaxID=1330018 RepID=A0A167KWI3_CALVF|nr:hypothetical protein CALVIDRAFT_528438 [Calocera viscosa TUFC12733]
MTDNLGRQAPLDELATATAAAKFFTMLVERGEEPNETSSIQSVITAAPSEMEQNITITEVQVETLASRIRLEREDTQIIRMAEDFSLRLACEGYMEACNELLTHNPDALNFLVKRGLEMVWHTVGPRPDTPYPQLTEAELLEMEEEQRYYDLHERNTVTITERVDVPFQQLAPDQVGELAAALAAVQHLAEKKLISRIELGAGAFGTSYDEGPITMPTEEEERRGLEVFRNYISRRDEDDRPMNVRLLSVYANLALKYDLEEEGKRWLDLCLREVLKSTSNWVELASVASGRYTSVQLGNGALQQLTGTTPEIAKRAGQDLATALRERWQTGEARPFVSLSWPDLLRRIQAASDNSQQASDAGTHEPYMREAATEQSIAAAEERLGIILPADYKTFLRLTNGTGSSSSKTGEPELAPVEEIAWDEETPRICMFKVEPLPRIHGKEWNALPDLKRVLRISVDGWEEYVYLIEPEMVALLPGQEDAVKEGRWRASTWAAWRADHIPYESFRDYMERLLLES